MQDIEKSEMISTPQVSDDMIDLDPAPHTHIPAQIDEEQQKVNVPDNTHIPEHVETNDVISELDALSDALSDVPIRKSVRNR